MAETPFSRVGKRLRGISQIALQVAQGEEVGIKSTESRLTIYKKVLQDLREVTGVVEQCVQEEEADLGHRRERNEALITISRGSANAATVFGADGQNIRIILLSDPEFILEILTEGQPAVLETAFRQLDTQTKKKFAKWLK